MNSSDVADSPVSAMTPQEKAEIGWDRLREILLDRVLANEKSPDRVPITELLRNFANEFGKTEGAVRQYYYANIHPTLNNKNGNNKEDWVAVTAPTEATKTQVEATPVVSPATADHTADETVEQKVAPPPVGSVIDVTVTGMAPYGAFVVTQNGYKGLIHISEVAETFVEDVGDFFYEGETVKAYVVDVDRTNGRLSLSTKRLGGKEPLRAHERYQGQIRSIRNGRDGRAASRIANRTADVRVDGRLADSALERPDGKNFERTVTARLSDPMRDGWTGPGAKEEIDIVGFLHDQMKQEISREARQEVQRLLQVYGPVKVVLALVQAIQKFDAPLAVVRLAAERLDYEFNRHV